jgi:release factor glutamine methyltransferase
LPQAKWTILDLLRWTTERFQKEGLATPRLDAEVLLADTLGRNRVGLYTHFDQPLQEDELARFKERIKRRLAREPVAYILGKREFWSLDFKVTPDVLIPRPDTETLVAEALKAAGEFAKKNPSDSPSSNGGPGDLDRGIQILEIGTGSGAIGIILAKELPSAAIVATDCSAKALRVAEENAERHGVRERIVFLEGDLFGPLKEGDRFDLVVTNPPYISQPQLPLLDREVRDFEPLMALDGGPTGLEFFQRTLAQVGLHLRAGGWFLAEIGAGQDQEVRRLAEKKPSLEELAFIPDLAGIQRVFKARKKY